MKLGICGDSWMSPVGGKDAGTHFSELLCSKYNWELYWYARPGSSNGGICLQIEQAIKDKVDLVLFGTTTYNRTEYTLGNMFQETGHRWEGYPDFTLKDVAPPSHIVDNKDNSYSIVSDNLIAILTDKNAFYHVNKNYGNTSDEDIDMKFNAFHEWFKYIYHPSWKAKIDKWCLFAVLTKLQNSTIPNLCVIDFLGIEGYDPILSMDEWGKDFRSPDGSPGYHTSHKQQIEILEKIECALRKYNLV
jgi:hypothetical protein